MANTVRKVKRGKTKEFTNYAKPPCIVVSPPLHTAAAALLAAEMKVTPTTHPEVKNINVVMANTRENAIDSHEAPSTSQTTAHDNNIHFNVNQLIAELSQNSRASKGEIENIQRKLLQQANEILKVNAFANCQPPPGPRIIDSTQKYSSTAPGYGRIPVIAPRTPSSLPQGPSIAARLPDQDDQNKLDMSRQPPHTGSMAAATANSQLGDTQLVPERLQEAPRTHAAGVMINGGHQGNMQRVAMLEGRGSFFYETGLSAAAAAAAAGAEARGASARDAPRRGVPGVPPYRMPPAPEALPGAPAPLPLHTHSNKFPIERSVILSSAEKGSKVPALDRRRPRLSAVAPDAPPKPHAAWTGTENQQAGTSADFRQYQESYGYAMNQGAIPRTHPGYEPSPKPPVPAKNTAIYGQKLETPNNSQSITVTVETGKDNTRDAPKSTKSVSKTYNTLKDMISSRFKNKDSVDNEKQNESAPALNNSEERKKSEEPVTPRNTEGRKLEQGIYGRPIPQSRPEPQYTHAPNNMAYPSPSTHRLMQQQIAQQQMLLQQARSQEMLASSPHARPMALGADSPHTRPMALGADSLYQQYGPPGRRSAVYQRDIEARNMANFTSLKQTGMPSQLDNSHTSHSRADLRSPQQLEREIVRHQGLAVGRRAASHPHLLDDPQPRQEITTPQTHDRSRRNSHGNLLERVEREHASSRQNFEERESDDGGFRSRRATQDRSSFEDKARSSGRSLESRHEQQRMQENHYRRTPDSNHRTPDMIHKERRTPDSIHHQRIKEESGMERNDESASQKSADSVYNSSGKTEAYVPQPASSRHTPSRIEDLKAHGKKGAAGSGASSDYDKNGGVSSNVDSGRGSVAYSSGRAPASPHDTSADSDAARAAPPAVQGTSQTGESEWADIVECELRQILEPRLAGLRLDSSASSGGSVTPPLPPLSPASDVHKRNSLPARGSEYPEERRRGREGGREGREGRESPRWHGGHKKHSSKRDHHYKKHLFGLDTTDMTSTTTRSLDLSSLLDGRSDSSASGDARAIRRQLRGLETMYAEVLQLLGVRKPQSLPKHPAWESRLSSKRRYGSMSSLPSSSVSSRPRDKRRGSEHRKKHDMKGINKRFQRLESHVVTLARSVAHLSSEMRTQHLVMQEMDNIRAEIQALRHMYKSQQYIRSGHHRAADPSALGDPERVKRLTKFFGDEPPLMRLFLKKLGYEKYAGLLEKEKVGAAELPYVGEDKLRALGVPLGPRMRILKEAGVHSEIHLPRDDHHTTTTLAIV